MALEIPVGIDLGTTFSAVATLDEAGRTVMLRNYEGDLLTPSIVLFSEAEVVVGKDARNATMVNPELVAEWVKRDMGAPYYSRAIHGQYLPPEVIQACILRKIRGDIVRSLGGESRCVITVPAYFDEVRRKATADAGEMAGLKVLDIVNEPTAAALAFGEQMGYLTADAAKREALTVLVYDLGGGTFDCTLLQLSQGVVYTIATDGDVQLGGHDWDLRLLNYLADEFQKLHNVDLRQSAVATNRLLNSVIEAKHALSARQKTSVRIDYRGAFGEIPVTRELFAELTADLLERTSYTTRQVLADATMQWHDVSRVLLVGGSTRMPMVGEMLRNLTGKEPDRSCNPDEAVARGAALYASYLLAKQDGTRKPAFEVTNVNSHSLGIEGIDPSTMRKTNVVLIPRNTALPVARTERFTTRTENQRSIVIRVLEGESSLPGECTAIGRTVIRDLPPGLPQGWPIEVAFEYAANGRLNVRASVPGTHHSASLDLERSTGMSNAGIDHWKRPIDEAAGFDVFESMVQDALGLGGPPAYTGPTSGGSSAAPSSLAAPQAAQQAMQPSQGPPPDAADTSAATQAAARKREVPVWLLGAIGYVLSAVFGLGLGYLVLSWLRPDSFPPPW
jgi:molecular chaperone DnaK